MRIDPLILVKRLALPVASRLARWVVKAVLWLLWWKPKRYGNCCFWGSQSVRQVFEKGLETLNEFDPDLYNAITGRPAFIFFYAKSAAQTDRFNRIYCFSEKYLLWGHQGVAAWLVFAFFVDTVVGQSVLPKAEAAARYERAQLQTREWLSLHEWPPEFIVAFKRHDDL